MASHSALFTASRGQTLTYLLAVCPFSIAFLVFINATVSFVVTDLIGLHDGEGDAVGTLGFADELLALAACPLWGLLSDHIGVRHVSVYLFSFRATYTFSRELLKVCTVGYAIVALALVLFVQAKNIYPQLLLGRLLFSLGGAAISTMVTAVLPAVTRKGVGSEARQDPPIAEVAVASAHRDGQLQGDGVERHSPSSRLAGFAGMFAGCGALVSLAIFLPLPDRFQKSGISPSQALQYSYYLVAVVAVLVSIWCFFGLRNLPGEEDKKWKSLWVPSRHSPGISFHDRTNPSGLKPHLPYWKKLSIAFVLGFRSRNIGLGYLGGLVARASSVGISLFIPLFVNRYYRASGLCEGNPNAEPGDVSDIKRSCSQAYVLASILTGVSQLVALIAAPAFGFLSEKPRRYHLPLLFATLLGIAGYIAFGLLPSPQFKGEDGNPGVFVVMALIGISQIGAIVCSLAVLSNGILSISANDEFVSRIYGSGDTSTGNGNAAPEADDGNHGEEQPLLTAPQNQQSQQLSHLKGSIAGIYSLYGGAGILVLTKIGGLLFDVLSPSTPFFIMAGFNGILCLAVFAGGLFSKNRLTA